MQPEERVAEEDLGFLAACAEEEAASLAALGHAIDARGPTPRSHAELTALGDRVLAALEAA